MNKFTACKEGRFEANITALKNYICNNSPLTDLPGYYQDMLVALEFSSHMEAALKTLENNWDYFNSKKDLGLKRN